jgi:hypothetical protein
MMPLLLSIEDAQALYAKPVQASDTADKQEVQKPRQDAQEKTNSVLCRTESVGPSGIGC